MIDGKNNRKPKIDLKKVYSGFSNTEVFKLKSGIKLERS